MSGKDLSDWRKRYQITRYQLAQRLEMGESTIRAYEAERLKIPVVVVLALREIERTLTKEGGETD